MADIKTAFRTKSISLDNVVAIFQGNLDPRTNDQGTLTQVPQGSLYIRSNGELYQKTGTANLAFSLITATGSAVTILDTDLSNTLTLLEGSNLTADRTLTFTTGDASRVLTINGDATLNDWFDQSVKTTGTPTFAQMFTTGNVGIGTTVPSAKLEIAAPSSGSAFIANLIDNTASGFVVKQGANDYLNIGTVNTSESIVIGNTTTNPETHIMGGNVGIGTTSPSQKLYVLASGTANLNLSGQTAAIFQNSTTNCQISIIASNTGSSSLNLGDTDTESVGSIFYQHADNSMRLIVNAAERMRIDSSGNVGIGTTSPQTKLHVLSSGTPTSPIAGTVGVFQKTGIGENARLAIIGSSSASSVLDMGDENNQFVQSIACSNISNYMAFITNAAERMRIDSSGNVGIGTTAPSSKLHVNGSIEISNLDNSKGLVLGTAHGGLASPTIIASSDNSSSARLTFNIDNTEKMRINQSGNVGIGTTSPGNNKLQITQSETNLATTFATIGITTTTNVTTNSTTSPISVDAINTSFSISSGISDSGSRTGLRSLANANTTGFAGSLLNNYGLNVSAGIFNATSGASITNVYGANINIFNQKAGTTITNSYGIFISNAATIGTITNRFDLYASSANAKNYFAGSVGIGTTSPTVALDVVGDIKASGTITGTLSFTRFHVQTSGASATPTGDIVAKFEKSATTESAAITVLSSTAGLSSLNMGDTVSEVVGNIAYNNASDYMSFTTNGSEAMRIDSSGKTGIGASFSPSAPLHVQFAPVGVLPSTTSATAIFQNNGFSTIDKSRVFIIGGTVGFSEILFGDSSNGFKGKISLTNSLSNLSVSCLGTLSLGGTSILISESKITQSSTTAAKTVLELTQNDVDDHFVNYIGTEDTSAGSILTGKTSHGGTTKFIKCKINGTTYYLQASTTPA